MHFLQFESESRHGLSARRLVPWLAAAALVALGSRRHVGGSEEAPALPRAAPYAPRRWQPSKFAYTVVVRQSAFQGQQRAFTSLMLPGGILQPTSKDRCHPCACCTVCLRRRHGHHLQGPLNRACSAKISHARKGAAAAVVAAAATVEVAKAPLHARGTTTGILLF